MKLKEQLDKIDDESKKKKAISYKTSEMHVCQQKGDRPHFLLRNGDVRYRNLIREVVKLLIYIIKNS